MRLIKQRWSTLTYVEEKLHVIGNHITDREISINYTESSFTYWRKPLLQWYHYKKDNSILNIYNMKCEFERFNIQCKMLAAYGHASYAFFLSEI